MSKKIFKILKTQLPRRRNRSNRTSNPFCVEKRKKKKKKEEEKNARKRSDSNGTEDTSEKNNSLQSYRLWA